jgi:acyl-CoA reductase-like NAD-dependent aldehyde dehydrogenase
MVTATERRSFSVLDPADGSVTGSVASAGREDAIGAVAMAADAAAAWALCVPRERAEILRRGFEKLTAEREPLARLIVREMGKARAGDGRRARRARARPRAQLGPLIDVAAHEKVERLVADAVDRAARDRAPRSPSTSHLAGAPTFHDLARTNGGRFRV